MTSETGKVTPGNLHKWLRELVLNDGFIITWHTWQVLQDDVSAYDKKTGRKHTATTDGRVMMLRRVR